MPKSRSLAPLIAFPLPALVLLCLSTCSYGGLLPSEQSQAKRPTAIVRPRKSIRVRLTSFSLMVREMGASSSTLSCL
jgi:hypothetical protein